MQVRAFPAENGLVTLVHAARPSAWILWDTLPLLSVVSTTSCLLASSMRVVPQTSGILALAASKRGALKVAWWLTWGCPGRNPAGVLGVRTYQCLGGSASLDAGSGGAVLWSPASGLGTCPPLLWAQRERARRCPAQCTDLASPARPACGLERRVGLVPGCEGAGGIWGAAFLWKSRAPPLPAHAWGSRGADQPLRGLSPVPPCVSYHWPFSSC